MPALKPSVRGFNHPIVSAKPAKENVRPPVKMVSIAPLLKRKPMKELYVPKYKLKKSRPEHPLYVEYKECIDSSRETLRKEATEALDEAYKGLLDDVAKVKLGNEKAVALVKAQVNAVMAPLSDEVVGITSPTGEKSEMKLFDQISAFKTLFQEEEEKLSVHWEAWESVQEQIAVLGQHVLGEKGVVAHVDVKDKVSQSDSYLSAIARLNKELKASLNGPVKEVENAGEEALRAIEEMEKDLDQKFKVQKAKVIAMITEDD